MYLGALVSLLLLDTAVEAWAITITGWPWLKTGKNALYALIAITVAVQVIRQRRWREFTTPADIALLVFTGTLALSAVLSDAPATQAAQGSYVYLRAAVVFYALRVLRPGPPWIRRVTIGALTWAGLNAVLALIQIVAGPTAYTMMGWNDLEMALIHRAQGLYPHPNDLGHLLGLTVVGLFAWLMFRGWHWPSAAMLLLCAAGLAATQSRESLLGAGAAIIVVAVKMRLPVRKAATVLAVMSVLALLPLTLLPGARAEVARRATGLGTALGLNIAQPAADLSLPECGPPPPVHTVKGSQCRRTEPEQEIRVVFAKQSFVLLQQRPITGYGPGTFGGSVALAQDPQWNRHPRFGPGGFSLHGFHGRTVDSFLLHLLVEAGLLGLSAFLAWFWFLTRTPRVPSLWTVLAPAAIAFALITAVFSNALEGAPLPPLIFAIAGLAWTSASTD
ncbi:O-antigen ligase family protein [Catelliglobosispora koreensis]|uniref:O-antigen ligase family protein n=1 Tax=Catelliglobosispora koreensis TaxID=129052 RepID=UPI00036C6ED4|nr:O-antigen ligase family protein [Catelliglobosispora koreensis]